MKDLFCEKVCKKLLKKLICPSEYCDFQLEISSLIKEKNNHPKHNQSPTKVYYFVKWNSIFDVLFQEQMNQNKDVLKSELEVFNQRFITHL